LAYEVASGLVIAGRRGRLAQEEIHDALEGYWALQLTVVDADRFYQRLPHFSHVYGISTYDASYAAVAELEKAPLITADEKLFLALEKDFRWVRGLGDLTTG
jgi:predicted nucleic acid-binding protein